MFKKLSVLIFFGALFFFTFSEQQNSASNYFSSPSPTKTPTTKQTGVENLILDSENVSTWCPFVQSSFSSCSEEQLNVKVKTFSKDAEKNKLNYHYEVSGGKIIGQGANVIWNFLDVRPGEYTITASVGDENNIRKETLTKTVRVQECDCCMQPCECPMINVTSSKETVYKGETFEFTAELNGGSQDEPTYNWAVENGVIIEGQGTTKIRVQVLSGETVTATVEIGGLCASCPPTQDSESVKINK